jgi:hypothetical protein
MLRVGKTVVTNKEETSMRFSTTQYPLYCGLDLHARTMYVCILDQRGEVLGHRNRKTNPETFLKTIAPYREGLVVAVACMFTWYWLADLCADDGIPCVLGHALYMQAIHGGKAKNAKIDSQKIAALLRGGMLPQADVSPAKMRATRDLLRCRMPLAHKRAELLAHVQNTTRQYNLPTIGKKIADTATRDGGAERGADPAVPKSIEVDLALITYDDEVLREVELPIVKTAKHTLSPLPLIGHPRSLLFYAALVANGLRVLLLTRAWRSRDNACALSPIFDEDGMRDRRNFSVAERSSTRLCTRRVGGERTSICVWCSHVRSAP